MTPAEEFAALFGPKPAVEPEPPGPRLPAPNHAQGTGGSRYVGPDEAHQAAVDAFGHHIRGYLSAARVPGGWTDLDPAARRH